jgi:hypothetical protein
MLTLSQQDNNPHLPREHPLLPLKILPFVSPEATQHHFLSLISSFGRFYNLFYPETEDSPSPCGEKEI